ncbi:MAG TPA: amidase [Solirubrobacterales bacterium]|jgi:Asp-tRNA(Asn)/Glu-tRNA(Gln) amidotransferase A subunit family amidase
MGEPSATTWLARLDAGEVSSRELVERTLRRIESANAELNAVTAIYPERSLAAADDADRERARGAAAGVGGRGDGSPTPLLGLPVTIKDTVDVEGWPTTAGVVAARDRVAASDSSVVRRLRAAGAIVVAKTNVPECSSDAETDNALFGRTDNPHDHARTPGGSSGGEAALMGADASVVGIGVDGGCSIRLPSHYCGGVGIRPTGGRVPETGLWPSTRATGMFDLSCIGPMGRYVEDLELLLGVIAGADGIDPLAPPVPVPAFGPTDAPLRVGFYTEDPHTVPTAATIEAVARAAAAIGDAEAIAPPPAADANDVVFGAIGADGGAHIKEVAGDGPHTARFQDFLDDALPSEIPSAVEFEAQMRRLFTLRAAIRAHLAPYDIVVCPVAPGPAPLHNQAPAEGDGAKADGYSWLNYASTYSVAGLPVAVVPAGEESGLPLGVQIVANPFRDDVALAAARRVESALGGFRPAPRST